MNHKALKRPVFEDAAFSSDLLEVMSRFVHGLDKHFKQNVLFFSLTSAWPTQHLSFA